MLSDFFSFLQAIFQHWLALMSAGPFLIEKLLTLFWRSARERIANHPNIKRLVLSIALLGAFIAFFQTWEEEHVKAKINMLPRLDTSRLYQDGFDVAAIEGININPSYNTISFMIVTANRELDFNKEFEYGNSRLLCSGTPGGFMAFGATRQISYGNFLCRIQGSR
jgi:hypothetical protein